MRIVHRGIAIILAVLSLAGSALAAPVETALYRFTGGSDGSEPFAGLIADKEGALYGTTQSGGRTINCNGNCGTVFKLTPPAKGQTAWNEIVLYRFTGGNDGSEPVAGLIADKEGALYSTTAFGGTGNGTVFKLTPPAKGQTAWKETVLYRFTGGSDGIEPRAGLLADKEGALYGTTQSGGGTINCNGNCGTVFKLTPPAKGQTAWKETVLYRFTGGSDGFEPLAGLIADEEGALYGTTQSGGGTGNGGIGFGTVFKLTLCHDHDHDHDHDEDRCPAFLSEE